MWDARETQSKCGYSKISVSLNTVAFIVFQVQCTKPDCRKWRQLTKEIQLTASLAATYRCGMKFNNIKVNGEIKESQPANHKRYFKFVSVMITLCLCLQSEGPDQCSQPEDLVSW